MVISLFGPIVSDVRSTKMTWVEPAAVVRMRSLRTTFKPILSSRTPCPGGSPVATGLVAAVTQTSSPMLGELQGTADSAANSMVAVTRVVKCRRILPRSESNGRTQRYRQITIGEIDNVGIVAEVVDVQPEAGLPDNRCLQRCP